MIHLQNWGVEEINSKGIWCVEKVILVCREVYNTATQKWCILSCWVFSCDITIKWYRWGLLIWTWKAMNLTKLIQKLMRAFYPQIMKYLQITHLKIVNLREKMFLWPDWFQWQYVKEHGSATMEDTMLRVVIYLSTGYHEKIHVQKSFWHYGTLMAKDNNLLLF